MLKEILLNCISINEEKNEISIISELVRDDYLELKHYFELIQGEYNSKGNEFDQEQIQSHLLKLI